MTLLQAFILAVVQGITEFLPISSSAHLVFVPILLGWDDQGVVFDIAVHVGTLLAVVIYFYKQVWLLAQGKFALLRGDWRNPQAQRVLQLGLATVPVVVLGLALAGLISDFARALPILAATSIGFGLLLGWADKKPVTKQESDMTFKDAFLFGIFQALALIPGTSRSGSCVTGGRIMGYSREFSGTFGTLMAIPTIALAGLYSLTKIPAHGLNWATDAPMLLVGMGFSFLTALAGIHILVNLLSRIGYWPFVIYRIVLGVVLLLVWIQ